MATDSPDDQNMSPKPSAKLLDLLIQFPLPPPSRPSSLASSAIAPPTGLQDRPRFESASGLASHNSISHASQLLKKLSRLTASSAPVPTQQQGPVVPEKKLTISLPITRDPGSFSNAIPYIDRPAIPSVSFHNLEKRSTAAPGPPPPSFSLGAHTGNRPLSSTSPPARYSRKPSTARTADRTKIRHASESVRMTVTTSTTKGFKDLPPSPSLPYHIKFGIHETSSTASRKLVAHGSPFDPDERIEDWRNDILDTVLRGLQEVSLDLDNENYRSLFDSHVSVESTISNELGGVEPPKVPLKMDRRSFLDLESIEAKSSQQSLATSPSRLSTMPLGEPPSSGGYKQLGKKEVRVERQVTVDYDEFASGLGTKLGAAAHSTLVGRK
jgi:hypothetical protein